MRGVRGLAAVAGLALSCVGFSCVGLSSAAFAASSPTLQSGWWNEVSVGPLAGPTVTPADQLQVSFGLKGPLAFAAVRIPIPAGTEPRASISLRLAVAAGSTVGTPAVSACPTTGKWSPGADQKAAAAPGYSCLDDHQADGVAGATDETWTVPVAWAAGGAVSVALVPTQDTTVPFSISYDDPTSSSISVVNAPPPTTTPPVTSAPAPTTPALAAGTGSSTAGVAPAVGVATVVPSGGPTVATPSPGAAPSLGSIPSGTSGTSHPVAAPASAAPGGGTKSASSGHGRSGRIMAFVLLVILGLALFALAAQPDRRPRLLGPMSAAGRGRPAGAAGGGAGAGSGIAGGDPARPAGAGIAGDRAGTAGASRAGVAGAGGRSGPASDTGAAAAPAPVRGIGRFARPRLGPPKRL